MYDRLVVVRRRSIVIVKALTTRAVLALESIAQSTAIFEQASSTTQQWSARCRMLGDVRDPQFVRTGAMKFSVHQVASRDDTP